MRFTSILSCFFMLSCWAGSTFAMPSDDEGEGAAIPRPAGRARPEAGCGAGGGGGGASVRRASAADAEGEDAATDAGASGTSPSSADAGAEDAATDAAGSAAPSTSSKPQLMDLPVDVLHYVMEFSENEKNFSMANKAAAAAYRDHLKSLKHGLIPTPLADDIRRAPVGRYRLMDVETRHKLNRALPEYQIKAAIRRSCQHYKYVIVDARDALLLTLEQALSNSVTTPSKAFSLSRFMMNAEDSRLKQSALQCIYGGMALIENTHYKASAPAIPAEDAAGGGGGGSGGSAAGAASGSDGSSIAAAADEKSDAAGSNPEAVKAAIQKEFDEKNALKKFVVWQDALAAWRASGAAPSPTQPNFVWITQEELESFSDEDLDLLWDYFAANPTHTLVEDMVGKVMYRQRGHGDLACMSIPGAVRHILLTNTRRDIINFGYNISNIGVETIQLRGFEKVKSISIMPHSLKYFKSLILGFLPNLEYIDGPNSFPSLKSLDLRTLYAASLIIGFEYLKNLEHIHLPYESAAKKIRAFVNLPALHAVDIRGFRHLEKMSCMFQECENLKHVKVMPGQRGLKLHPVSFLYAPVLKIQNDETTALLLRAIEWGRSELERKEKREKREEEERDRKLLEQSERELERYRLNILEMMRR